MSPRIVEVRQAVLKKNDLLARELRARFAGAGVFVTNLVSAPGAGKTALLERTLRDLGRDFRVAALVGDLATDNDAQRLARSGALVRQITTGTVCHLDAEMIDVALREWDLASLDFLFLENVGNLVCPSSYDLGENLRVVLHAVTEGEDKPLKYPTIYNSADLALITKIDLAVAVEFDRESTYRNMRAVRPDIEILECSARSGVGMEYWVDQHRSRRLGTPALGVRGVTSDQQADSIVQPMG
ncbi:MAG TPA: hydrogenase nickel incorporation protein HypB [Gemmatimonadaceae bacterium]|jgi:hydrogenase nickel incorporation protein HypB